MQPVDGFIETADVRLHYVDWGGDGPPLLLIHATGFHARLWDPYAEQLADRFRVIALDQRGHGDSGLPRTGFGWQHPPDDVFALIHELEIEGCAAAGHSSGGTAAGVCAARYPGSIARAVLIDPVLPAGARGGPNPMAERTRARRAVWDSPEQFEQAMAGRAAFSRWQPPFLSLYARHGLRPREDGRYELKCAPENEAAVYDAAGRWDPWPELERLTIPSLILRATGDGRSGGPPTPADAASRIPGARGLPLPTTHFIPMEAPDAVLDAIQSFLQD